MQGFSAAIQERGSCSQAVQENLERSARSRHLLRRIQDDEYGRVSKDRRAEFRHLISGDPDLYVDIIEPLGYEAKKHNDAYLEAKAVAYNVLTREFLERFCLPTGQIDWPKLVEFNSGNLPAANSHPRGGRSRTR